MSSVGQHGRWRCELCRRRSLTWAPWPPPCRARLRTRRQIRSVPGSPIGIGASTRAPRFRHSIGPRKRLPGAWRFAARLRRLVVMLRTLSNLHFVHPALQIRVCSRVVKSSVEARIHIDVSMRLMEPAMFFVLGFSRFIAREGGATPAKRGSQLYRDGGPTGLSLKVAYEPRLRMLCSSNHDEHGHAILRFSASSRVTPTFPPPPLLSSARL